MIPSKIIFLLLPVSIFFTDAAEVASSGSGKAIYTSSRNPIASYFKEHKNKLRPYFTRPASDSSSNLYGQGLSIQDDTNSQVEPSTLYSHSNYYDASGSPEKDTSIDDPHGSNAFMDLYDSSSNPEYQASNAMYSVMDPLSNGYASPSSSGVNPGYYADPHLGSYSQPSYHPPGLPSPSTPATGNAGYYGTGDTGHAHPPSPVGYENSIYSSPPGGSAPAGHDNTLYHATSGSPAAPPSHHHGNHAPTSNNHNIHNNHDKNNEGSDNSDLFPIPGGAGYGASEEEEVAADNGYTYDYGTTVTEDDETLMELPLFGGGGGGDAPAAPAPTPAPAAVDPTTTDNPLSFLNLVGTDFQPGRLVNIFFGLFIMLFMIIFHGYALWILGIAYLPGTRSLNQWELDKDKIGDVCNLVLDALEYWENKID